jgi:hypothetical protein
MIVEGTHPSINIDSGNDEPDMTLKRLDGKEWVDYKIDRKLVKSPFDMDELPVGRHRLV